MVTVDTRDAAQTPTMALFMDSLLFAMEEYTAIGGVVERDFAATARRRSCSDFFRSVGLGGKAGAAWPILRRPFGEVVGEFT